MQKKGKGFDARRPVNDGYWLVLLHVALVHCEVSQTLPPRILRRMVLESRLFSTHFLCICAKLRFLKQTLVNMLQIVRPDATLVVNPLEFILQPQ